jgi:proteasome lid subunit RPN8/RPN11
MTSLVKPLVLERAALDDVLRHAREADPDECCGALVERRGRDEVWRLENVQDQLHARDPVANPRTARTAYALGHRDVARNQLSVFMKLTREKYGSRISYSMSLILPERKRSEWRWACCFREVPFSTL